MPVTPTYPGVYLEEISSGVRTIVGVATSICAFVGFTARGPVNKAVRVLNFGDYERAFGGLDRNSEVSYAVQQFFLNGGTDAYVVRVALGAANASVTLRDSNANPVLNIAATSPGVWGNFLRLDLDYATSNSDSTFNLTITQYELQKGVSVAIESETFLNLSMNSRAANYAVSVVNASSKFVRLTRPAIAFAARGFSWSGELLNNPGLLAGESVINGMLDGVDPFTLNLNNPTAITTYALLETALTNAIAAAGLATRLEAKRADSLGADDSAGKHLKLTSLNVIANPNTAPEFSSVQIIPAASNDAAVRLKLGLLNGGREKSGASANRPMATGTVGGDISDKTSISGNIGITINDHSSGAPVAIFTSVPAALPATPVGPGLADALQTFIRALPDAAAQNATVKMNGASLRVVPSASTPNASIEFTGAGAGSGANGCKLTGAAGAAISLQQYSLGVGKTFGGQSAAVPGVDGTPPNGATIIGNENAKTGIYALRDVDLFNLMCIPLTPKLSDSEAKSVLAAAIALCEQERAFFIVDPDPTRDVTNIALWASQVSTSRNAAIYFPRLQVADPLDDFRVREMPASGAVAGLYARTDSTRGVWKAPAGTDATVRGAQGLSVVLTDGENGTINPKGVNALRTFPVYNTIVWGARTMRGDDQQADEYKYIPVRRLALYIEETLYRNTQWVVFEPNDEPLWAQIRLNIGAFMHDLFVQGAFQGKTAREAYFVKCDKETTTQNDINRGVVNIIVGFAPLKPAEFVIIKLQQMAGQIQV